MANVESIALNSAKSFCKLLVMEVAFAVASPTFEKTHILSTCTQADIASKNKEQII